MTSNPRTATASAACLLTLVAALAAGCATEQSNLDTRYAYFTTGGGGGGYAQGSLELGSVHLKDKLCDGVAENRPESGRLDETALVQFLQHNQFETKVERARADLVYVDVTNGGGKDPVRLRVAILDDPPAAAQDLHHAILQHGDGSWGVHRSNLAVLGPIGSMDQILDFAGKSKLACWGVLTVAGRDDDFVVPGGYMEF